MENQNDREIFSTKKNDGEIMSNTLTRSLKYH